MEFMNYILDEGIILIPVLYILGLILKGLPKIKDNYIPIILLFFGELFSLAYLGLSVDSAIQGVLITGVTVYGNQVYKQLSKNKIE